MKDCALIWKIIVCIIAGLLIIGTILLALIRSDNPNNQTHERKDN